MKRLSLFFICLFYLVIATDLPVYSEDIKEEKARVAILEFSAHNCPATLAKAAEEMMGAKLFEARIFDMVERSQIDQIFKELELQQSGCTDSACLVEVGKLLTANKIVTGAVHKIEDYTILVKVIDVASGKIEANFKESSSSESGFMNAVAEIAYSITREYKREVYWGISVSGTYLYPMGDLSDLTDGGYGANVDITLYNALFWNSLVQFTTGYYTFKGKEDAVDSIMMVPLGAYIGYSLTLTRNLSLNPLLGGGYLFNQMKYDPDGRNLTGNYEYKSEMFHDSFLAAKIAVEYKIVGMFSLVFAPSYMYIFEKDTSNQLVGAGLGVSMSF